MRVLQLTALVAACWLLGVQTAGAQGVLLHEEQEFHVTPPTQSEFLGLRTAVSGQTLVAARYLDDQAGLDAGSVEVYVRSGAQWSLQQKLLPASLPSWGFGEWIVVSDDTLFVTRRTSIGSGVRVHVYVRNGGTWTWQSDLTDPDADNSGFGQGAIAVDGGLLLIGRPNFQGNHGNVWSYRRTGTTWQFEGAISAPSGLFGFGANVALDGSSAIVAAQQSAGVGEVHFYSRSGSAWLPNGTFTSPVPVGASSFGNDLDLSGSTAVVGVRYDQKAFVYERQAGTWAFSQMLLAPPTAAEFGWRVRVSGDLLAVGAPSTGTIGAFTGEAFLYRRNGASWTALAALQPGDGADKDRFGEGMALDGELLVCGAPGHAHYSGAVYAFSLPGEFAAPYCFGDGSGAACPCGNASAPGAGEGCVNSSGRGGLLIATGSSSVAADDLGVQANGLVRLKVALLIAGTAQAGGGAGTPFYDGLLCVGGMIKRLATSTTDQLGVATWVSGLNSQGLFTPGSSWNLQAWHRDSVSGPCANRANLSSAIGVTFTP